MKTLLERLSYKGQQRIAIINSDINLKLTPLKELKDIQIDNNIDARYPYDFMIIFVRYIAEVDRIVPMALHNLAVDGVLWFCFPRKKSAKDTSEIDRENGWKALNEADFFGIRTVNINEEWSAIRFRDIKQIKTSSQRFTSKRRKP